MTEDFCNSHFSFEEKKRSFFPEHPLVCPTFHKPRIKRLINLEDFSLHHQNLICISRRPHSGVPPEGAPGPALHGGHGPHINPLYVTMNE